MLTFVVVLDCREWGRGRRGLRVIEGLRAAAKAGGMSAANRNIVGRQASSPGAGARWWVWLEVQGEHCRVLPRREVLCSEPEHQQAGRQEAASTRLRGGLKLQGLGSRAHWPQGDRGPAGRSKGRRRERSKQEHSRQAGRQRKGGGEMVGVAGRFKMGTVGCSHGRR